MNTLIALALLQAASVPAKAELPPMTVPKVSVRIDGEQKTLDSKVRSAGKDILLVDYSKSRTVVPAVLHDGTDGVVPMTVPGISYDQPLAYRDHRTGEIHVVPGVTEHREPVVVAKEASARDSYVVFAQPRNEAERLVGVCDGKGGSAAKRKN